jgi:hypothetical protein
MSFSTAESNSTRLALFIFYIRDWKPIYLKDTAQMTGGDTISSTLDTYFACVQRLALIELGDNFRPNFDSWHLALQETKHRLQRWGIAAGITNEQSEDFWTRLAELPPPQVPKIHVLVKAIATQFSIAEDESRGHHAIVDDLKELNIIDAFEQMKISEPKAKQAYSTLEKLGSGYQSILCTTSKTSESSSLIFYQPRVLETFLRTIGEWLERLEKLYPEQVRVLAAQEADDLDSEAMEALLLFTQGSDPILEEELRVRVPRKHDVWENIDCSDNATMHIGHNYNRRSQHGVGGRWSNITSGGHANVHAGNNYDY